LRAVHDQAVATHVFRRNIQPCNAEDSHILTNSYTHRGVAMSRGEVLQRLAEHRDELVALHVRSLALFGSVARNEAGTASDVDLLVEFSKPVGIFEFLGLKERLEEILQRRVDLVTRDALKPQLRDRILGEAVRAT
jgi:predicted nucleotidyltransferase